MSINKDIIMYQSLLDFENKFHHLEKKVVGYIHSKYIGKNDDGEISLKEFSQSILKPLKPRIVSQDTFIRKDIKAIIMASDIYQETPEDYKTGLTEYGYPDNLRCHHILWRKNNFHRCQKKVFETDDSMEYCKCHQDEPNQYETDYRKLYMVIYREMKRKGELDND